MWCQQCGANGDGRFCAQCGAPLSEADVQDPNARFWGEDEPTNAWTVATQTPGSQTWVSPAPSEDDWTARSTDPTSIPLAHRLEASSGVTPPVPPPYEPTRSSSPWPVLLGAAVLVGLLILGAGGATVWVLTDHGDDNPVASSVSTTAPQDPNTTDSGPTDGPTVTTTTTTTTTTTPAAPTTLDELSDLRADSLGRLTTYGQWAVALSAKSDGMRDDRQVTSSGSHVFRLPDILELHEYYEGTYDDWADVYLVRAEDLGSTRGANGDQLWMTIVDPGFLTSRVDAELWCEIEYPLLSGDDLDNACYPRQLTSP